MGLPPPSGSPQRFERVYSPPEPPSRTPARRGRRTVAIVGATAVGAAGGAVWLGVVRGGPDGGPDRMPPPGTPSGPAAPTPAAEAPFTRMPGRGCSDVPRSLLARVVGDVPVRESASAEIVTCVHAAPDGRALIVKKVLFTARGLGPVERAKARMAADRKGVLTPSQGEAKTVRQNPVGGRDAYRAFIVARDEKPPFVVAIVGVRVRNVQVTVSYNENAPRSGSALRREKECLEKAVRVAGDVVAKMA